MSLTDEEMAQISDTLVRERSFSVSHECRLLALLGLLLLELVESSREEVRAPMGLGLRARPKAGGA